MKIYNKLLQKDHFLSFFYPFSMSDTVFVDIETTGLSSKKNNIYCIGLAFFSENNLHIRQLFARNRQEEKEILTEFLQFLSSGCKSIITFNGKTFDLPFLEQRCAIYGLSFSAADYPGKDLLQDFRKLKHLLSLSHLRQKDLEAFLGIDREDKYDGGKLISVYTEYEKTQDPQLEHLLWIHNYEDMLGMFQILSLYKYEDLLSGNFQIQNVSFINDTNYDGISVNSLQIHIQLSKELPQEISGVNEHVRFIFRGREGIVNIPVLNDTLRYYLPDYKNYYFLTEEKTIVHKSIAQFVDSQYCQKSTRENCFLTKTGFFIESSKKSDLARFQRERKDKKYYIDISELWNTDTTHDLFENARSPALMDELQALISMHLKKFKPLSQKRG